MDGNEDARPVPSPQSVRPLPYPFALDLHREINQHQCQWLRQRAVKCSRCGLLQNKGHLSYRRWPSPKTSLPEKKPQQPPSCEDFSSFQMSPAPAEQEGGTVRERGSNHREPHWSQSPPWFLELYQSRWEPARARTGRKWAVSSFFLIPPRITSFQALDQYCQRTAVHPTRNTLLTITLFREIITHAHTRVKIIYSLFFIS